MLQSALLMLPTASAATTLRRLKNAQISQIPDSASFCMRPVISRGFTINAGTVNIKTLFTGTFPDAVMVAALAAAPRAFFVGTVVYHIGAGSANAVQRISTDGITFVTTTSHVSSQYTGGPITSCVLSDLNCVTGFPASFEGWLIALTP